MVKAIAFESWVSKFQKRAIIQEEQDEGPGRPYFRARNSFVASEKDLKSVHLLTGRNRLSAESWLGLLGGDSRSGIYICWSGQLGFWASLHSYDSILNRLAEIAFCPESCLAQPSNLGLEHVSELPIPVSLKCGEGSLPGVLPAWWRRFGLLSGIECN